MDSKFTRTIVRISLMLILIAQQFISAAQTNISGVLTSDSTLTLAGSPYIVTGNLVMSNGFILTINPGVTVKFNANMSLLVLGQLKANGTSLSPITFTANTNSPIPGFWGGISFGANSSVATVDVSGNYVAGPIVNNAIIEYAGSVTSAVFGSIALTGLASPYINNTEIRFGAYPGIYSKNGTSAVYIKNTYVHDCAAGTSTGSYTNSAAGINIQSSTNATTIDGCLISKNTGAGIAIINSSTFFARITNNQIFQNNNSVTGNGGGIYYNCRAKILNNKIYKNTATTGAGVYSITNISTLSGGSLSSNFIFGNTGTNGSGFFGAMDSVTRNVFAYNFATNDILKVNRNQYNNHNQYINNSAAIVFNYTGTFNTAAINRNAFSNNKSGSSNTAMVKFEGTYPTSAIENNFMSNTGFTYMMQLLNNDNTIIAPVQNCFWKTAGALSSGAIQAIIYDILDDVNQGQINFTPYQTTPRLDCPISAVIQPLKAIIGDSVLVYWNRKTGEDLAGYKIYYGGSSAGLFSKSINIASDTFCKISILENIDSIGVSAFNSAATQTTADFISGAQSWYTYADWDKPLNPTLANFTPKIAKTGDTITITGTNLTGANIVSFGAAASSYNVVNSPGLIKAVVGAGASGNVFVQTPVGGVTLSGFTYIAMPNIISFSPNSIGVGKVVNIKGTNFTGASFVSFGGFPAAGFTISGDTLISATLGTGNSGDIIVVNAFGSDTISGFNFCTPYVLNLNDTTAVCGDSVVLDVTSNYASYLWSTGETTSSIFAKKSLPYSVQVLDQFGCPSSDNTLVILNKVPTPTISGRISLCAGTSANYKTPKNSGRTYNWIITGGTITSGQATDSINVTWGAAGIGTLQVSDSVDLTGCKSETGAYSVTINDIPSPVIIGKDSVCAQSFLSYKISNAKGHACQWSLTGGTIITGQGTDSIYVSWSTAGLRTMSVSDSNTVTGCKGISSIFNVRVLANPTPVVIGSSNACAGSTYAYSTFQVAGHTYTWTVNNGVIVSGQGTSAINVTWNIGVSFGALNVSDSLNTTGCKGRSSNLVVTINSLPSPVIYGPSQVCASKNTMFTTDRIAGMSYHWTVTGGVIASGQNKDTVYVTWGAAGAGTLVVTDSINATGCKGSTLPFNVFINAVPTPGVSGKDSVCVNSSSFYQTTLELGHAYEWTVTGGTILSGQGTESVLVSWTLAGSGSVSLKDSNTTSGCVGISPSITVVILPVPTPIITGPVAICASSNASYSTSASIGHYYIWTITNGIVSSGQGTSSINVTWNTGIPMGTLTVLDSVIATGCKGLSAQTDVILNALPTPVISGLNNVCANSTAYYTTPKNAGHSYRWTISGGVINFGQATDSIRVTWGAVGSGTLTVSDSINASTCKVTTVPFLVTINANPTPVVTGANAACVGSVKTYSTPSNLGRTYIWTVTNGAIVLGQGTSSLTVAWNTAGFGTVNVKDSINATGCKTTSSNLFVTINANPSPVVSGSANVCEGASKTYSTPFNNGRTYVWTITGGIITGGAGTANVTVAWGTPGTGSLVVSDSNNSTGCKTFSNSLSVTINPIPTPIVSGRDTVCTGSVKTYSTPAAAGHTYTWTVTGGTINFGQGTASIDVNWAAMGMGTVQVKDSLNGSSCIGISPVLTVNIQSDPNPVISGPTTICATGSAAYSTPFNPSRTYNWTATGGNIIAGQGTPNILITWGVAGIGSVVVSDSNNIGGCKTTTAPYTILLIPNPTPVITGANTVCDGSIQAYSTPVNTGRAYVWTITGGSIISGQGTDNINVLWNGLGTGTLTVSDSVIGSGCIATTPAYTVSIVASPAPVIAGSSTVCLNSIASYTTANNTGRVYTWMVTGGTILSGQGTSSIDVQWGSLGTGSVSVSDSVIATGCKSQTLPFMVSIGASPTAIISGATNVCANAVINYGTFANPNRTYIWTPVGGTVVAGQGTANVQVSWANSGNTSIYLLDSVNGTACKATASRNLTVNPLPSAYFSLFQSGGAITLNPAQTGINYKWYFGDGDSSTFGVPTHFYALNGLYTIQLHAVSKAGCVSDSSMDLDMTQVGLQDLFATNFGMTATPNPFNGQTKISFNLNSSSNVNLEVFDLTGRLVQTIVNKADLHAGKSEFIFDAKQAGTAAAVYLVRLQIGDQSHFIRLVQTEQQ